MHRNQYHKHHSNSIGTVSYVFSFYGDGVRPYGEGSVHGKTYDELATCRLRLPVNFYGKLD